MPAPIFNNISNYLASSGFHVERIKRGYCFMESCARRVYKALVLGSGSKDLAAPFAAPWHSLRAASTENVLLDGACISHEGGEHILWLKTKHVI